MIGLALAGMDGLFGGGYVMIVMSDGLCSVAYLNKCGGQRADRPAM